jgi:hypothetical protein
MVDCNTLQTKKPVLKAVWAEEAALLCYTRSDDLIRKTWQMQDYLAN